MGQDLRRLKIVFIISLIVGLGTLAAGIYYIVARPTVAFSYIVAVLGIALIYMGFQGARRINVPSNAPAIMNMCALLSLVTFVCFAFLILNKDHLLMQQVFGTLGLILSVVSFTMARTLVRKQRAK